MLVTSIKYGTLIFYILYLIASSSSTRLSTTSVAVVNILVNPRNFRICFFFQEFPVYAVSNRPYTAVKTMEPRSARFRTSAGKERHFIIHHVNIFPSNADNSENSLEYKSRYALGEHLIVAEQSKS